MRGVYLTIVIPSYNEEENFKRGVLKQVTNYLNTKKFKWEVILVDDGSIDKTAHLLKSFTKNHPGFSYLRIPHAGKLKALQQGVYKAKGEIILISDFDQSTPVFEFNKFLPFFRKGNDLVIGSRIGSQAKRLNDPPFRYIRSRVLNFIVWAILFKGINDTQCGFKAIKKEVAKKVFANLKATKLAKPKGGFMGPWDIELLFVAKKMGYKIASVPITWQYFPSKKLSAFSEPARFVWDILTIKSFDIMGKYKEQ